MHKLIEIGLRIGSPSNPKIGVYYLIYIYIIINWNLCNLQTPKSFGIQSVSKLTVSHLQNNVLQNVNTREGDFNFSNTTRTSLTWASEEVKRGTILRRSWKKYNNYQGSCHNVYYAWRHESKIKLHEIWAIIHDGMVINKIIIHCLRVTTKAINVRLF